MSAIGAMLTLENRDIGLTEPTRRYKQIQKPHWKETQSDSDRNERLRKAKEKRDRKTKKRQHV